MYQSSVQQTNIILVINNSEQDNRKFIVWNTEGERPVEVLQNLLISRIAVENQKKTFEHPIEDGGVITDYEILEPQRATLQAYISIDDTETLSELNQLYMDGALLRIRAENKVINNVIIAAQPFEVNGSMLDKTLYSIGLKQAQFIIPQYVAMPKAKKKSNSSRVNSGVKQAEPQTQKPKQRSWLYSLFYGNK